jgi:hypothetical protein
MGMILYIYYPIFSYVNGEFNRVGCYYYYIQQVAVGYLLKYHQIALFIRGLYDFRLY